MNQKDVERLFQAARAVRQNAYAPYSGFKVGAAVLSETGAVYAGANVEEAAYVCTHAEQGAISQMIASEGAHRIDAVMVVAGEAGDSMLVTPCGHCRQWLREHNDTPRNLIVYTAGPEGVRRSWTLEDLLPYSFGPQNLDKEA
ncbi:MAG: cytidine deaminase [Micavibrio aeruginosavorus]|uniref:Cytidine deaminase n=1 Tax=Micavibrio aeruginosavorus TaxID=349221 RepID=A0A7T5R310_9BACT|nr:MAG: cytidine deaminase [Micavibrio aeruginosavorus]